MVRGPQRRTFLSSARLTVSLFFIALLSSSQLQRDVAVARPINGHESLLYQNNTSQPDENIRTLPEGNLILGYAGCDGTNQDKVVSEARAGVNVINWFSSNLVRKTATGEPEVQTPLNFTCVAEVAKTLREENLETTHIISIGG